jgi:hypothetical protein
MILFHINDKELSGWWKALWIVALIVVPVPSSLIHLVARGKGMAERQAGDVRRAWAATDSYIKQVAGQGNPADQIATAKGLLDNGTPCFLPRGAVSGGPRLLESRSARAIGR